MTEFIHDDNKIIDIESIFSHTLMSDSRAIEKYFIHVHILENFHTLKKNIALLVILET